MEEKKAERRPCVYMLKCGDGSIYTGWTNDLEKRIKAHSSGKGAKYTRSRLPVELVHFEFYESKEEALRREAKIKKLDRLSKLRLIEDNIDNVD